MLKNIVLLLAIVSLILGQDTTTSCVKPCYGNSNPCPKEDQICVTYSSDSSAAGTPTNSVNPAGCAKQCISKSASADEIKRIFSQCNSPCQETATSYKCTNKEKCITSANGCQSCQECDLAACLVAPCSVDKIGAECAKAISDRAVCVDNYCGGCTAEWYVDGRRVCVNTNNTCKPCTNLCPSDTKPVVDPDTGCTICDKCEPVCPSIYCPAVYCPYGYVKDEKTGCPTCTCERCPPESYCKIYCPNGYVYDEVTKCRKCECAPIPCPRINCTEKCENGFIADENGCQTCKCKECSKPDCPSTLVCRVGYFPDSNGCPTCKCLPECTNDCPYGYDYLSATTNTDASATNIGISSTYCKCKCPPIKCLRECPAGNVVDKYGCQTCECLPDYSNCSKVMCDIYCQYGYVTDENGCETCRCKPKPECTTNACRLACNYGFIKDKNGCETCDCEPCPLIRCARYCEYGYVYDKNTGCQTCECNEKPRCPFGVDSAFKCNLDCSKGYETRDGCPGCSCTDVKPCVCTTKPSDERLKCKDGSVIPLYSNICDKTRNCTYVKNRCPIVISVTVTVELSEEAIKRIIMATGVTNVNDVTVDKKDNGDGSFTYTLSFERDGLEEGKNGNDVNNDVAESAKQNDPNAISFVLQDDAGSVVGTSYGSKVLVSSLIALVVMLFM